MGDCVLESHLQAVRTAQDETSCRTKQPPSHLQQGLQYPEDTVCFYLSHIVARLFIELIDLIQHSLLNQTQSWAYLWYQFQGFSQLYLERQMLLASIACLAWLLDSCTGMEQPKMGALPFLLWLQGSVLKCTVLNIMNLKEALSCASASLR